MRTLLASLMIVPATLCQAAAPEDEYFIGFLKGGKMLTLEYIAYRPGDDSSSVYGTRQSRRMHACWVTEDGALAGVPGKAFVCAPRANARPTLVYRDSGHVFETKTGLYYKEAMRAWRGHPEGAGIMAYYVCAKGCGGDTPRFMFDVGYEN